jgi:CDP-paratose 2-epimerase
MSVAIVTGSAGLVGAEAVRFLAGQGLDVIGIDNDLRSYFFGPGASTGWLVRELERLLPTYRHVHLDIRHRDALEPLFSAHGAEIALIVHAAAQPSHDWAAREPFTDFSVNAHGTLVLLEAVRTHAPEAVFIFCSTNKVYGDTPNRLPLEEQSTRLELPADHRYHGGIDTTMSIDASTHSLFGVSKAAADLMVQEYGRYFHMPTVCLRCGCLTGPSHAGAKLHGFLSYLMRCTVTGDPYTVLGYRGKQVRDNLHSADLVKAFASFHRAPRPAAVYNMGGGRASNCSMLEAIALCEEIAGRRLDWELLDEARLGDHRWWISDIDEFRADYPEWSVEYDVPAMLREIHEHNVERWTADRRTSRSPAT